MQFCIEEKKTFEVVEGENWIEPYYEVELLVAKHGDPIGTILHMPLLGYEDTDSTGTRWFQKGTRSATRIEITPGTYTLHDFNIEWQARLDENIAFEFGEYDNQSSWGALAPFSSVDLLWHDGSGPNVPVQGYINRGWTQTLRFGDNGAGRVMFELNQPQHLSAAGGALGEHLNIALNGALPRWDPFGAGPTSYDPFQKYGPGTGDYKIVGVYTLMADDLMSNFGYTDVLDTYGELDSGGGGGGGGSGGGGDTSGGGSGAIDGLLSSFTGSVKMVASAKPPFNPSPGNCNILSPIVTIPPGYYTGPKMADAINVQMENTLVNLPPSTGFRWLTGNSYHNDGIWVTYDNANNQENDDFRFTFGFTPYDYTVTIPDYFGDDIVEPITFVTLITDASLATTLGIETHFTVDLFLNYSRISMSGLTPILDTPVVFVASKEVAQGNTVLSDSTQRHIFATIPMTGTARGEYAHFTVTDVYTHDIDYRFPKSLDKVEFEILDFEHNTITIPKQHPVIISLKVYHEDTNP